MLSYCVYTCSLSLCLSYCLIGRINVFIIVCRRLQRADIWGRLACHSPSRTLCRRRVRCTMYDVFSAAVQCIVYIAVSCVLCDHCTSVDCVYLSLPVSCLSDYKNITSVSGISGECLHLFVNGFCFVINILSVRCGHAHDGPIYA